MACLRKQSTAYSKRFTDSLHFNAQYTRSWFQTLNDFENLNVTDVNGNNVGNTDQRSKIGTVNFTPYYTQIINENGAVNLVLYVRRDVYN